MTVELCGVRFYLSSDEQLRWYTNSTIRRILADIQHRLYLANKFII